MTKIFSDFRQKYCSRFVKTTFYLYRETFQWFLWGKTELRFISVGINLQKIIQLLTENYRKARQKCNLSVKENILRKKVFFSNSSKKIRTFGWKRFWLGCQYCNPGVKRTVLRNFFGDKKHNFFWFPEFERKIFRRLAKIFGSIVKTEVYVFSGAFWWEIYSSETVNF